MTTRFFPDGLTIAARPERADGCWAGKWMAIVLDGDTELCVIHGKDTELMALVAADVHRQQIEESGGMEVDGRFMGLPRAGVDDELPDSYTHVMCQWQDEAEAAL